MSATAQPGTDAERFVAEAERITNTSSLSEAVALFADDCVAEWVFDGVYQRFHGIEAITAALDVMLGVNRDRAISGCKKLICADHATIVNTWQGGFHGGRDQYGTEIWTLRDGMVVHHQMYVYLKIRDADAPAGQLRMLFTAPKTALGWFKHQRRVNRQHRSPTP